MRACAVGGYVSRTPAGVPVAIILRADDYRTLYEEAPLFATQDGNTAVISPEYLAAMKLVARRAKDRADLEFMVVDQVFDIDKARHLIRRHLGAYALEDFNAFVEVAQWRGKRE